MRSWRKQNTLPDGWLLLPLVATLPNVAGEPLSHTYRFILDPSVIDTLYLVELFANALPASFSGSDYLGCFNADPDRRPLRCAYQSQTLTKNARSMYPTTCSYPTSLYFYIRHPHSDHTAYHGGTVGACGMHALCEPYILLDKGILLITNREPHRLSRALATGAVVLAAEEEKNRRGLPITTIHTMAALPHNTSTSVSTSTERENGYLLYPYALHRLVPL